MLMEIHSVLVECLDLVCRFGLPATFSLLILGHVYLVLPPISCYRTDMFLFSHDKKHHIWNFQYLYLAVTSKISLFLLDLMGFFQGLQWIKRPSFLFFTLLPAFVPSRRDRVRWGLETLTSTWVCFGLYGKKCLILIYRNLLQLCLVFWILILCQENWNGWSFFFFFRHRFY